MPSPKKFLRSKLPLPKPAASQRMKEKAKAGPASFLMCRVCGAVFYKKLWKRGVDSIRRFPKNPDFKFTLCPACAMEKAHLYEGEVVIEHVPRDKYDQVLATARHVGDHARIKDPMDRIFSIEGNRGAGRIRLTTSENQLAQKIGNKIKDTFQVSGSEALSKGESVIRVRIDFDK